jgi:hypothetical protein
MGVFALLLQSPTASAQTYLFNKADFPTGTMPRYVVRDDFNHDGIDDLAVVNVQDSTVSVLIGNPDGTFQAHVDYAIPNAGPLVTADFNGDGKLDLAVANGGSVGILLGNGDGTFQPHTDSSAPIGEFATALVVGDFNRDGRVDLIAEGEVEGEGTVSVLLGNGDGTFKYHVQYVSYSGGAGSMVAADFNGDGKLDLAVVNVFGGSVSVLLGNGDGSFGSPGTISTNSLGFASITVGDLNHDGNLDLIAGSVEDTVSVLLGNGDGTFQPEVAFGPFILNESVVSVLTGDFNNDGDLDVAAVVPEGVALYLGNGNGTLRTPVIYAAGGAPAGEVSGDFNRDGLLDLAVANTNCFGNPCGLGSVSILLGSADGTFEARAIYTDNPPGDALAMTKGDFNGDGIIDLAAANFVQGTVSIYLGNKDGSFQSPVNYPGTVNASSIVATDINGDSKTDLVVGTSVGPIGVMDNIVVLLGNGDGSFQPPLKVTTGYDFRPPVIGDFNGDGKPDLALITTGTNSGSVSILLGNGDGNFRAGSTFSVAAGTPVVAAAADLNGDRKLDLVVGIAGLPNVISVFLGNGDGSFQAGKDFPVSAVAALTLVDLNGDGKLDVVTGGITVLLGNGDGTLQPGVDYGAGRITPGGTVATATTIIAGDFNRDGKVDLATVAPGSGANNAPFNSISIWLGNGDGTLGPPIDVAPPGFFSATAADFDGDGSLDLAATMGVSNNQTSLVIFFHTHLIALSTNSLSFPAQLLSTSSSAQPVLVSNPGVVPLSLSSIASSGDFSQTNNCGPVIAPGAKCTADVTFTPAVGGPVSGTIAITDNAPKSPQVVTLTGEGTDVRLSTNSLTFAGQNVGTATSQVVTLTNHGSVPLLLASVAATGDFSAGKLCPQSISARGTCRIVVQFKPTQTGVRTGTLTITDSDPASPQIVTLTGTGTAPAVRLSTTSLNFAGQLVGTSSAVQTVTLTNNGDGALTISSVAASGDFARQIPVDPIPGECAVTVAPGTSCGIDVVFKPQAGGSRTGSLSITDDAANSPQSVALSGAGEDFAVSSATTSATVTAGQTASYTLGLASQGGFSGAVSLTCAGAPSAATCSLTPASVTLAASGTTPVTVRVATTGRSLAPPATRRDLPDLGSLRVLLLLAWLIALSALASTRVGSLAPRRTRLWVPLGALLLLVMLWVGCGSGGGTSGPSPTMGTPAGTYMLTVAATSSGLTNNVSLTLVVN